MLFLPTGIFKLLPRNRVDHARFDPMHQPARLTVSGNQIIPAPGDVARWMKSKDPVGQGIPLVMVEKQPAVKVLTAKCFLYPKYVHAIRE